MRKTRAQLRQEYLDRKEGKQSPDVVAEAEEAISAVRAEFSGYANREASRRKMATDSRYWFAIYFKSKEEMERFRVFAGLAHLGGGQYLDGREVAEALDVDIGIPEPEFKEPARPKKRLSDLT